MPRNLEVLLEIQAVENRLRELDAEIAALPRRVASIEAKLSATQQALERAQAAQTAQQSERRQVEREIDELKAKIQKIRGHSGDVKTNQEYRALLDEIAFAEAQIAKHEERLLEVMEQADGLERQAVEIEARLQTERSAVNQETAATSARAQVDQAQRGELAKQCEKLRSQADDAWVRRFDRVLRMRGQALAQVDREACAGCRVRLRPQFLQEMASDGERLFVCESCGRILYLEPAGIVPAAIAHS
ncbi:MAG: zinc ribbon domain-containing protein [Terriglobales bacterium]